MKRYIIFLLTYVAVIAFHAEAKPWNFLFTGQNLEGWKVLGSPQWSVEDGVIKVKGTGSDMGWLVTENSYADFVFRARFKWSSGNSGIQIRSRLENGKMIGYQCNLDPSRPTATGSLLEENGRGMLKETSVPARRVFKKDDWNTYEISAIGDHIVIHVNNRLMVDYHDPPGAQKGIIALQLAPSEGAYMEWTDLRILEIPNKQDWIPLFNGKDLSGWHPLGDAEWDVTRRAIHGKYKNLGYGWLVSDGEYDNFHLSFQFKVPEGNSGMQFRSWVEGEMVHGWQADLASGSDWISGHLYDQSEKGILVKPKMDTSKIIDWNGWNTYEITAIGPDVELFINGIKTIEHSDPSRKKGVFAFQIHRGIKMETFWRDIRIIPF